MNRRRVWAMLILTALPFAAGRLAAQGPPGPEREGERGELQREMRKFFADRLRADLDLSDEQAEQILPRLQRMEQERGAFRRQRSETIQALRDGIEHGATDEELQGLLDTLDDADRDHLAARQSVYGEIDQFLTVRQRVRLRFFVEDFPRMMREKIMELRGGRNPGWDRGDGQRRRPPGQRP